MTIRDKTDHSPYMPYDQDVEIYSTSYGHLTPWQFSNWQDESMTWKEGVYLHAGLNPNFRTRLTGPDALRLLKENCINNFQKFSIGASKHTVMCNANGNTMADGLTWRLGEDEFINMGHGPYINFLAESGKYDVKLEDQDKQTFLFQVAGPKSLNVIEALTGESFRDLDFFWHRDSQAKRKGIFSQNPKVRIYRVGVARTLAYEVHGHIDDAKTVYQSIMDAGADYGIKRIGMLTYGMNHTEGGFAQSWIHFLHAWPEDPEFMKFLGDGYDSLFNALPGSAGEDLSKRFANPFELELGHMIKFDHEFVGREALEKVAKNQKRKLVTLEWNEEDILEIYAAQFKQGSNVQYMDFPSNDIWQRFMATTFCDDIVVDDAIVGMSSGRMFSQYYRKMISLGIVNIDLAKIGNEVKVLWGDPGKHQKLIRAKVSRFPYLDLPFNNDINVKNL